MKKMYYYPLILILIVLSLISFDYSFSWYSKYANRLFECLPSCFLFIGLILITNLKVLNIYTHKKEVFLIYGYMNLSLFWLTLIDFKDSFITAFIIPVSIFINSITTILFVGLKNKEMIKTGTNMQTKTIDDSFKSVKISFWNEITKANEEAELNQELTNEIRKFVNNWNNDKSLFNTRIEPDLKVKNGVFSTLWLKYAGTEETDFEEYEKASLFVIKDGEKLYLITSIHAESGAMLSERWGHKESFLLLY